MGLPLLHLLFLILLASSQQGHAQQCGSQAGGALCPGPLCCNQWGFCGMFETDCGPGCQSNCPGGLLSSPLRTSSGAIISSGEFESMLPNQTARSFYTYDAFIAAASAFTGFGTTGDGATRKRELAAFFAQSWHEINGGAASGHNYNGEFRKSQLLCSNCCPCPAGRQYYERGPLHLSWNFNYLACGNAIGVDLLNNPDLAATDPTVSFKTALWLWMTPQNPKPSCHDAMVGGWRPSGADERANRRPGFGMTTNIINGKLECGRRAYSSEGEQDRAGYYRQYCSVLGVEAGENVDCHDMRPYEEEWTGVGIE